jgi:surface polysaccharide O-acyltransferase-like enzyme
LLASASALAYVPLALAFTPWEWLQFGPFSMQVSRPLHYVLYFVAGIAVGGDRLETGLLAADGMLPLAWPKWLAIAAATFLFWLIPTALTTQGIAANSLLVQIVQDVAFSLACAGSCMFALALVLRFATGRSRVLDDLSANAFGMYMIHYPFVVWLQYALLDFALPAIFKFTLVFAGTLSLSWPASSMIRRFALAYGTRRTGRKALAKIG